MIFIFSLTKRPFGECFCFLGFLSKSKFCRHPNHEDGTISCFLGVHLDFVDFLGFKSSISGIVFFFFGGGAFPKQSKAPSVCYYYFS